MSRSGSVSPIVTQDSSPRVYVGWEVLETRYGLERHHRRVIQRTLPSPLYWYQFPGGKKLFWNERLIGDYLMNGGRTDTPQHQRLVEQHLASLPK